MNKIRFIAIAISSLVAAAPFAGAQAATRAPRADASVAGQAGRGARRGGKHEGLLRGLQLSAAEKSKIKSVHAKYSAESKPMRESLRSAMQEARADRQKGDTAAARAVFDRTKTSREALRGVMERENSEIRSALAPANQKQFDANLKQVSASRGKGGRGWMGEKGKRARPSNG